MSKPNIVKHYSRIIALWPRDPLRPQVSFQAALQARISPDSRPGGSSTSPSGPPAPLRDEQGELRNANALYSLLDNRYAKKHPVPASFYRPQSNPSYYDDLIRELEHAPSRSWFGRQLAKWKGTFRFS